MMVQYDTEAGATYVELSDASVARTVSVGDLVMVDVDEHGEPVGVDFAVLPGKITDSMLYAVAERFPPLKDLAIHREWLLASC
jgi:uncharacterized protein YuzE